MNLTVNKFNHSNKVLFKGSDVNIQQSNKATTPIALETKDSKISNKKKMFAIGTAALAAAAIATIAIVNKKARSGSDIVNNVKEELAKQEKNTMDIKNKVASNVDKNLCKPAETIPVAMQKEVSKDNLLEKSMVVVGATSVAAAIKNESNINDEIENSKSSEDSFKSLEDDVKTKTSNKKSRSDKKNEVLLNAIALDMERKAEEENRYEYKSLVNDSKNVSKSTLPNTNSSTKDPFKNVSIENMWKYTKDENGNYPYCPEFIIYLPDEDEPPLDIRDYGHPLPEDLKSVDELNNTSFGRPDPEIDKLRDDINQTIKGTQEFLIEKGVKTKEEVQAEYPVLFPSQNDSSQDDTSFSSLDPEFEKFLDEVHREIAEADKFFGPHSDIDTDTEIDEFTDSDVDFSDVDFDFVNACGHNGDNYDDDDDDDDFDDFDDMDF